MLDLTLEAIRRELIAAIAEEPSLRALLILKGGNALGLIHGIGLRASLDLDYSMEADADDSKRLGDMLFRALTTRPRPHGLSLFDYRFGPRPSEPKPGADPRWGGYLAEFKIIETHRFTALQTDLRQLRMEALSVTGHASGARTFRIEISK